MKIVKNCAGAPTGPMVNKIADIPTGTIFRYGIQTAGPYMKLYGGGFINLDNNTVHLPSAGYNESYSITGYKALPNAMLVTGEE